jgi:oxygen-independent coproporphyrinogen-3 oxidase
MIRRAFQMSPDSEVTVEAHPDTAIPEELSCLAQGGFTRISFGIQSTQDEELVRIGRPTTSASARSALRLAREAGFTDINVDLIHGLPGQTLKSWRRTVQEAVDWGPDHVSSYALTVEDHSHLQVNIQRGIQSAPDPSLQNQMEDEAALTLAQAGFEQYEISNYSQPHRRCRHNTLYWTGQDYLGIGPSAQSYVDGTRFGKTADLDQYNRMLHSGTLPIVEAETLSEEQRRREEAVFGLRLSEGIASNSLGVDLEWNERITRLMDQGLLQERAGRIRLTAMGRRFADSVAVELL